MCKKTNQDAFHHIREAQATKGLCEMRCNTKINVLLHCNSIFTKLLLLLFSYVLLRFNFKAKSMSWLLKQHNNIIINSTQFNISGSFLMPSNGIFKLNKTSTSYKDLGLTPPPANCNPPTPPPRKIRSTIQKLTNNSQVDSCSFSNTSPVYRQTGINTTSTHL